MDVFRQIKIDRDANSVWLSTKHNDDIRDYVEGSVILWTKASSL